jgi:hypothetical protein
VEDSVWVELDWDAGKMLLHEFIDRYQFRLGVEPVDWPAIVEPTPSVAWDLGPIFAGDYPGGLHAGSYAVASLVLGTLQDCTEWWESVVFHDWAHPSSMFRPHKVDAPDEVPGWNVGGLFPNGDFTIFLGRDDAFGIIGHPWERSLCVYGERAVAAFTERNRNRLTTVLRRNGQRIA